MAIELRVGSRRYRALATVGSDLAIPLAFDDAGPRAFGAEAARAEPLAAGHFTGRVATGSSCNASVLTITPHGNGTHTETVAHLAEGGPAVPALLNGGWMPAWLAGVEVAEGAIDAVALAPALDRAQAAGVVALIVRTRPNTADKLTRDYGSGPLPPWFAEDAAAAVAAAGIEHWLVDVPSLDAMDAPDLPAHRAFFGLPPGSRVAREARRRYCTVTEMIYAPEELADGLYLLDLQVPRWQLEAVPSRPLLIAAEVIEERP